MIKCVQGSLGSCPSHTLPACRFENCQLSAVKGTMLLPSAIIINPTSWLNAVKPFLDKYADELPSRHTLDSELVLWSQLWFDKWDKHWKALKQQHLEATGSEHFSVTPPEEKILKTGAVPNTDASSYPDGNRASHFPKHLSSSKHFSSNSCHNMRSRMVLYFITPS